MRNLLGQAGTTLLVVLLTACAASPARLERPVAMGDLGERYVKLALALGVHDPLYIDAYYGPAPWRTDAEAAKIPLVDIRAAGEALLGRARALPAAGDDLQPSRARYLVAHLEALLARVDMLDGKKLRFDEEARVLYDAVPPRLPESWFAEIHARLERLLPGSEPLPARVEALRKRMIVPKDKLDAVFSAAVAECRRRTLPHVRLPDGESFSVEYVANEPWWAYNWYKGGYRSLIQINTDVPMTIDRAVEDACHELYPGHHVYNSLLEHEFVRGRGFVELSVYPLFSPTSLIAEATADFGVTLAFPGEERVEFERRVLYPLAGLDPAGAARYAEVALLVERLEHAENEVARRFLDGEIDAAAAADLLTRVALFEPERARKRLEFIERYRSYVINYTVGQDLVQAYIDRVAGPDPERRWDAFRVLLTTPRLAGDLR